MRHRERSGAFGPASWLAGALLVSVIAGASVVAQSKRDVNVTGHKYAFTIEGGGAEIRVQQDDIVNVVFSVTDIAHSLTISDEHYRIDKRAEPGKPATIRFRADKAGEFEIRCTLTIDDRCQREMKGKLVVVAK